jgi:hypothetical protein
MTRRYVGLHKMMKLREQIRECPEQTDQILRTYVLTELPRFHREVYLHVFERTINASTQCPQDVDSSFNLRDALTSRYIADWFDIQQNYAADVLRELTEFGLLKREKVGGAWWYEVK